MDRDIVSNVQVLDRALKLIDILAPEKELGVSEISSRAGLNRSTVHRLLEALLLHGYVEKTENGLYRIGMKIIIIAGYYINKLELITVALPHLWDLAISLDLSVNMAILDGFDTVFVARADPYRNSSIYSEIGMHTPAYATAHGQCLLAQFTLEALDQIIKKYTFEKRTENTITDSEALKDKLRKVRKQGYAVDDQGFVENMRCVGAPVYNFCGEPIAAISVSGSCSQLPLSRCNILAINVIETAEKISHGMCYNP